ncbi:hypothetical protein H0O03_00080 [Candidatus Micrarchaeota archaeon]|nr:hypothetical protein [Candidatus Micrarchaeota archaeon]
MKQHAAVKKILDRNARVEADKAWETSKTRRALIAGATYLVVVLFLHLINAPNPWLNALVPACAYILSTLTLPFVKKWWLEKGYKK